MYHIGQIVLHPISSKPVMVLAIRPYKGKMKRRLGFNWVVRVQSTTPRGWIEFCA